MLISTPLIFSGNLMSGQVGRVHLASGTLLVQSGDIASGSVHGFFGPTREIASGTVGVFDFGSGAVVAGTVGSGAIVSGNIASGQVGRFHHGPTIAGSGATVVFQDTPMVLSPLINPYADIANSGTPGNPGANPIRAFGFTEVNRNRLGLIDASGFSQHVCQDQFVVCRNATGSPISGMNAVYISGSLGSLRPLIALAKADSTLTMPSIGVAAENIANNADGYVMFQGHLENFDTSAFADGDQVYVSPSVAGGLTATKPAYPQTMGFIIKSHATQGIILVVPGDNPPAARSGGLTSGTTIGSGALWGSLGPTFLIASGTIGTFDIGSGQIVSGLIASGQVGHFHLAAKAAQSGQVGSGAIIGGWISGLSESIASGTIGPVDLASGTIFAGAGIGVTVALSGITISNLSGGNQASGIPVTHAQDLVPFFSGSVWTILTEETISGIRAVCISQSGNLRVAMASVSGRMPAMGVVWDNVLSGIQANVYTDGVVQAASGLVDYSGQLGLWLTVGRSGHVTRVSGSWSSGGFLSGDIIQRIGVVRNSGSFAARVDPWFVRRASG